MANTPLVSVLMTCYNREKFLPAAIESVLWQTFEDFELIIVDDRSTDGSVEIAREYARRDTRIRVVVNETNLGDYPNRNLAASLARGKFIKYHDSDDVMYPHCLAVMVPPMESEPRAGFGLSAGKAWEGGPCPMLLNPEQCYQREFLGFGMFNGGPANAIFRTDVFRELGCFPTISPHSDWLFWIRACVRVNVLLLPANLYWYRIHPGQHLQGKNAAYDAAKIYGAVWDALCSSDCPLKDDDREQAKTNWSFSVAKAIYRDLIHFRWNLASYRIGNAGLSFSDWLRYLRKPCRNRLAGTPLNANGDYLSPNWGNCLLQKIPLTSERSQSR